MQTNGCHGERSFYTHSSLETRHRACQAGPFREAPGPVTRQREWREDVGKSLHCGFHGKELVNQVNIQGLAGLNALGRLRDIEAVPSCLVLGWYVIRARG